MGQEVLLIAVGQDNYCFVTRGGSCSRGNSRIYFLNKDSCLCGFLSQRANIIVNSATVPGRSLLWLNLKGITEY